MGVLTPEEVFYKYRTADYLKKISKNNPIEYEINIHLVEKWEEGFGFKINNYCNSEECFKVKKLCEDAGWKISVFPHVRYLKAREKKECLLYFYIPKEDFTGAYFIPSNKKTSIVCKEKKPNIFKRIANAILKNWFWYEK